MIAVSGAPTSASGSGSCMSSTSTMPSSAEAGDGQRGGPPQRRADLLEVVVVEPIGRVARHHDVDRRRQHDGDRVDDGEEALDHDEVARVRGRPPAGW